MKKGFTLIELLIVMVVVSILVTVALPTYKTAMEKGRGLEGLAQGQALSDAFNTYFVTHNNAYGTSEQMCMYAVGDSQCAGTNEDGGVAGLLRSKNFDMPKLAGFSPSSVVVAINRKAGSKVLYELRFQNSNGKTTSRWCNASTTEYLRYCKALGATKSCSGKTCHF